MTSNPGGVTPVTNDNGAEILVVSPAHLGEFLGELAAEHDAAGPEHAKWCAGPGTHRLPYPAPAIEPPSDDDLVDTLQAAVMDTETHFETSDGCHVEPDGICPHGHPTWLVRYGLI